MSARRNLLRLLLCASPVFFAFPKPACAVQRFWGNTAGGSFNLPANWQLGVVPGSSDSAYFSLGTFTYTVNFPTNVSNTQLTINPNNVTFDLLSHQYQLTAAGSDILTAPIRVGAQVNDNALLRIINGTLSGNTTIVGWVSGSEDNLFISSAATLNSANLDIGHFGIGHLTIDSGAVVNSTNVSLSAAGPLSQGFIALDGAGTRWINTSQFVIGNVNRGVLTIDNGASVTSASDGFIGFSAGSTGSITVDGASTTDPSSVTIAGNVDVATSGTAFVSITNQALFSTGAAFVGRRVGSKGTVKITDNFASWQTPVLYIGGDDLGPGGTGTVSIANNGVLNVAGPITVWPTGTLQSYPVSITTDELRLRGGKLSAWSNFNAPISNGGGTIEVPGSNMLFLNNSLTSTANSLLQRVGTGDLYIVGPQNHSPNSTFQSRGGQTFLVSNAGSTATAATPATANLNLIVGPESAKVALLTNQVLHQLTVSAPNAGRQSFDLNSPTASGAFYSLSIYTPADKPTLWAAISNANRVGAPDPQDGIFDSHLAAHPSSRIGIAKLADLHGDPYLLIRPTRVGDLNLDGTVTISDFIDLSSHFGQSGPNITWQEGDVNYDGIVSISDFIDLSANFGSSYSAAAISPASVPEPTAILLAASTFLLLSPRPRTRCMRTRPRPAGRKNLRNCGTR